MSLSFKEYLGDSVYVALDGYGGLVLTTENGLGPSNTIVLEPEVYAALVEYAGRLSRHRAKAVAEGGP